MKKLPILSLLLLCSSLLWAQSSEVIRKYIDTYRGIAMEEMLRTGVPAAITLAQGIHETGAGQSELVRKSNNHFGIKCKSEWKGESVSHDDDARGECFRKYEDPMESYRDHSDFLKNRAHYAALFRLDPTDYEAWAHGLKKAGYATNPRYPQILIKIIRDYGLQEYSLLALEKKNNGSDDVLLVNNSGSAAAGEQPLAGPAAAQASELESRYPSGTFSINETDVVFVKKGTSYLKVAEEHDLSIARLFDFNDLVAQDIAAFDQLLFLKRKRKVGATEVHVVAPGETLHSIAQAEGIRLNNLMAFNFLKQGMQPRVGEKLYLRSEAPAMPRLTSDYETAAPLTAAAPAAAVTVEAWHRVQAKETLYSIAKKYNATVEDVMNWNNLQSKDLKIGQQLRIQKRETNAD